MDSDKQFKILLAILIGIVLLGIGSLVFVYMQLTVDYNEKFAQQSSQLADLSEQLTTTQHALLQRMTEDRAYNAEQRELLRNETMENFATLQNYYDKKTNALQLNLESQIGDLEEKNTELETKLNEVSLDFSSIIDDVVKAVVSIQTDGSEGSGVIFDSEGYILTNHHVVDDTTSITAIDYQGKEYDAELIGVAADIDLAVLKITSTKSFDYLQFADMDDVNVGERVIAVGNPLGLAFSVTEGIISALDRNVDDSDVGYIQIDVPVNPGNSGGPIVNINKEIVGITTYKAENSEGLSFAIPADVAEAIAQEAT